MIAGAVWLAAHYHFPATYSCRTPLSSISSTLASPGPGPATVRLACIRAGCEVWGSRVVREELFPIIRAAQICVRPPERVAISQQVLRVYKARHDQVHTAKSLVASLQHREVAQAQGTLTVYVQVPAASADRFRDVLVAIGYWGQTDSLTMCLAVEEGIPDQRECALPLRLLSGISPLGPYFTCILADFRSPDLDWEEIVSDGQEGGETPLSLEVYLWPLILAKRTAQSKLLVRRSLPG